MHSIEAIKENLLVETESLYRGHEVSTCKVLIKYDDLMSLLSQYSHYSLRGAFEEKDGTIEIEVKYELDGIEAGRAFVKMGGRVTESMWDAL